MTAELYASLARMLDYPQEKKSLLAALGLVQGYLAGERLDCSLDPFGECVAASTLAELQEEYVATFDFNPSVAPYLGHHLFGDTQKKGEYLIALKGEYRRHGYTPLGNELPDHLPLILWFLAHLAHGGNTGARASFIERHVLPGVEKLADSFAASRRDSPWRPVVEAIRLICGEDAAQGVRPAEAIGDGVPEQSRLKMVAHPEVRPC
ncbi:MAG: nitrate reductase molybdenum cofactor assembly chaperone [Desulfuromonadales bacterium]|nr:MAG: nitrate reductase molybdenum cofactor assembly chaperone [Desulfuromonadales bacterium]